MILRLVKRILPTSLKQKIKQKLINLFFPITIRIARFNHKKALKRIREKEKIKVVFLLINEANWKYEGVYELMKKDDRFDPVVVVCPYTSYGEDAMLRELNQAYQAFKGKGYNVIKSLNETSGEWLDVKKELKPDLVCFTNAWSGLTRKEYTINNFLDTLTCYVPYGFENTHLYQAYFNQATQNFVWKFFLETTIHQNLARKYARNKGVNTLVTGYPGMDSLLDRNYKPSDPWKIKDRRMKRIIWAPHHTIPGHGAALDYSTFLDYYEFFFELAERLSGKVQFVFKPHPILRHKLSKEDIWGKDRTDAYYNKWNELVNGQLVEGNYIDLFLTSDGMIHDSGSFVFEYLYTRKPVMFLLRDEKISERFNEVGKQALRELYHGKNSDDIFYFIKEVILNSNDIMKKNRVSFFNDVIKPPNKLTASENIYNILVKELVKE